MPDKLTKRLETEGKIRKQKAGFIQIESLLKEAILLVQKILEEVKKQNPQLSLKLNLKGEWISTD
jgi:hypothetical protein